MCKFKKFISNVIVCIFIVSLCACGGGNKSEKYAELYNEIIDGLESNELYAVIEINASAPVLLVTSEIYDDGQGNQAAIGCDVYCEADGTVKNIGTIESMGTAYPIAYDKTGLYAASGHGVQRFEIDEKNGVMKLAEDIYEQFDENGDSTYFLETGNESDEITEEEYYAAFEKYSEATVVSFSRL